MNRTALRCPAVTRLGVGDGVLSVTAMHGGWRQGAVIGSEREAVLRPGARSARKEGDAMRVLFKPERVTRFSVRART